MDDPEDRVIDLGSYLKRREEASSRSRSTFALWGGEGERSRFALPLWRSAYLAGGRRAAVLWQTSPPTPPDVALQPLVILDLGEDPARTRFEAESLAGLTGVEQPGTAAVTGGWLAVYLGQSSERRWYLAVGDMEEPLSEIRGKTRDDLLFLAGECAGLLFHKQLDSDPASD